MKKIFLMFLLGCLLLTSSFGSETVLYNTYEGEWNLGEFPIHFDTKKYMVHTYTFQKIKNTRGMNYLIEK